MTDTITITGNVATPPESRGAGPTPITSFRLASTQRRIDRDSGKWVDSHTNWYTVSAYRQLAVHALESLHKGQRVIVTGRLKVRTWENASGRGTSVDIDAESIGHDLLWGTSDFRRDDSAAAAAGAQTQATEWAVAGAGDAGDGWTPPMGEPAGTAATSESGTHTHTDREPAYAGEETPF